jgi:hypothetical protein
VVGLLWSSGAALAQAVAPAEPVGPIQRAPSVADSSEGLLPGATKPDAVPADGAGRGLQLDRRVDAVADTVRLRARRGRFETPRWVMLRSLAVPGWGQLHNGSWLKAAVLGGCETWLVAGLVEDDRRMRQLRVEADLAEAGGDNDGYNAAVDEYNSRLAQSVSRQWRLGGLLAYALMDAYVDAHFRDFKVEFEYDRVLKGGKPPSGKPPAGQTRLSLRWDF